MKVGLEWVVDAGGCDPALLRNRAAVERVMERIIADLSLAVVGEPHWREFPGEAGVTGLYLLTESHLSVHTFPEHSIATFNLYCCRERPEWQWAERLAEMLGARRVEVRTLDRGEPVGSLAAGEAR